MSKETERLKALVALNGRRAIELALALEALLDDHDAMVEAHNKGRGKAYCPAAEEARKVLHALG